MRSAALMATVLATCVYTSAALLPSLPTISRFRLLNKIGNLEAKRRRRKSEDGNESVGRPLEGDLPEFDIESISSSNAATSSSESFDPQITEAMIGSEKQVRPVKELIKDRALEKMFQFDETPTNVETLPDLSAFSASSGTGKKKARQEARRAAAMAQDEENVDLLKDLPPIFKGEDGKFSPQKVVESATWAGIFLLVAWEIYLNSPFVERAAPLVPFVYDIYV